MSAAAAKVVSKLVKPKAKGKGGRKRKRRGPAPATEQQKNAAKVLGMSIKEIKKLSPSELKAKLKEAKPKKKKEDKVKYSRKVKAEIDRLKAEQEADKAKDMGKDILPKRRATGPKGQEVQQGPLLSKVPAPTKKEMSPATRRRLGMSGMLKRGVYAPPASMVAEEMGLGSRGRAKMPTGEELDELIASGFEIKKGGGKVKRRMGGKVRGYGKALRGY